MDKCFIFSKHLNDNGCVCLKISDLGELIAPPEFRNFSQIKDLQRESSTIIVETCTRAILLDLAIPWLPERKARIAIPYALEDKVTQPVEELHFAFDKFHYQNNQYLIVVIDKQRMRTLIQVFDEHGIEFDAITLDWFALASQELIVCESELLINNEDFKGVLSGDLAQTYLKNHPQYPTHLFQDSKIVVSSPASQNEEHSYTWISKRLIKSKPLNLCQGEMQHGKTTDWVKKGYLLVAGLCGIWLISILFVNWLSLHWLNRQIDEIDRQIAVIYREFFPDAKQVISPKFRISQLLGGGTAENQTRFWFILNQLSKAIKDSGITVEQLRYQNKTISITLVSSDFESLQKIENKLKQSQLKVKQTQASTKDQQVVATLELT
ncbi:TPA: GspL family type II secretion system protein LspL [Legionella pneumophila]|nr:GspL family type II secretion system protein LspL [Legionella pneumophila]MDX1793061.1 GspL family type II secretion system protein LspL [Legionella pneumophila]HAT2065427.1 GspL family type II secretion system protein LspL [Legionella pneumophila]HAT8591920.1 general secretion pathway protein GspL [Legionella pneumophila]HAU1575658.1 general secretion pathway protein GspL [Legionella pneumophila]HAU1679665.1 general secretion pathway protein GspL [Legionella pneumophila]